MQIWEVVFPSALWVCLLDSDCCCPCSYSTQHKQTVGKRVRGWTALKYTDCTCQSIKGCQRPHPNCRISTWGCWLTSRPCWTSGRTWLCPQTLSSADVAAAAAAPAVAAAGFVSAGESSAWNDGRHPGPTDCAASYDIDIHQSYEDLQMVALRPRSYQG